MESLLEESNMKIESKKVGERYVVEKMRENGLNVGGEKQGNIVMQDFEKNGEGII